MEAYKTFVEERITGRRNLWDKMTNVKQKTWMSAGKDTTLNTGTEVLTLKATTSLFARLLVRVDLEEVVGMHEFSLMSKVVMVPEGSIHPSTHKTIVIKLLADLVVNDIYIYHTSAQSTELEEGSETCIVVD